MSANPLIMFNSAQYPKNECFLMDDSTRYDLCPMSACKDNAVCYMCPICREADSDIISLFSISITITTPYLPCSDIMDSKN